MEDINMKCQLQPGDRIRLVSMPNDPDPIPAGSLGTVRSVHEHGDWSQVDVAWDNGRQLMLCLPGDVVAVVSKAKSPDNGLKEES
jgi:hypothetical protein